MTDILSKLFSLQDKTYADFQAKLNPTVKRESIIGVRVPEVRKLAKQIFSENNYQSFLKSLPHGYLEENMLHAFIIENIKDYATAIFELERFLPYVDNWAVCDSMSPKVFKKHKAELINNIKKWSSSNKTYTVRFGVQMLMNHFLDDDFNAEYLSIPAKVKSQEYYVNMMVAWFFATALCKQWESTIPYIENKTLDKWTHNKTIQKAIESYRITPNQKEYLRTLKIK